MLALLLGLLWRRWPRSRWRWRSSTKEITRFAAVINGINLPLLLLAGVLLPISLGPLWLRVLAHFDPLYYLVVARRALAAGSFAGAVVWQAFAVLVPLFASGARLGDTGLPPCRLLIIGGGTGACTRPGSGTCAGPTGWRMRHPAPRPRSVVARPVLLELVVVDLAVLTIFVPAGLTT